MKRHPDRACARRTAAPFVRMIPLGAPEAARPTQRGNLRLAIAQLSEHGIGMLARQRREAAHRSRRFGEHSPGGYSLFAALVTEVVLTFMFLIIILGSTDRRAPAGFAPIAIGLGLTLIHLISIPVTNTSVNPARSTGVALLCGNMALVGQLWLFWIAPIVGAVAAGFLYNSFFEETLEERRVRE